MVVIRIMVFVTMMGVVVRVLIVVLVLSYNDGGGCRHDGWRLSSWL